MNIGSVLVTGANRGIGFEFIKQFAALITPPKHVFAACRSPSDAKDLKELQSKHSNITVVKIDLCDLSSLPDAVRVVKKAVGEAGLNLLINNAGIIFRDGLETAKAEQMMEAYRVNAVGPMMVTQAFLPLLREAVARGDKMSITRSAVINISSGVGSIAENDSSNNYAYRSSKAALNMITKNLSLDLMKEGILATAIHPGWVKTDMGGTRATMEISDSVKTLIELMATLDSQEFTGKFYHWSGREMAW